MLVGLVVPVAGVPTAVGLLLYFTGAAITVARAKWYSHIPFPLVYAAPVAGALVLDLVSRRPVAGLSCGVSGASSGGRGGAGPGPPGPGGACRCP
ncbi:DoxX family protein [Streptomyces sp. NBC_00631]|uniref:DoxX family protein n=1 Tax=Streptomyces sp. NBC_00631 TaxID=2975793 RepID=UPI00386B861B